MERKKTARLVEEFSGLGHVMGRRYSEYSPDRRRRFITSLSLVMNFDFYLIKERASMYAGSFREKAEKMLQEKQELLGVIVIDIQPSVIARSREKALIMREGKLLSFPDLAGAIKVYWGGSHGNG